MAFPVVQSIAQTSPTASNTSHTINLPASIAAGDLLVAWIGDQTISSTYDTGAPSGWTRLETITSSHIVYYRYASGSEGSTQVFTTYYTTSVVAFVVRITGAMLNVAPVLGNSATGGDTAPDPPSCFPDWSINDILWLAFGTTLSATVTGYPSGYSGGTWISHSPRSSFTAWKASAVATENPGAFATGTTAAWTTQTLAVRPAVSVFPVIVSSTSGAGSDNPTLTFPSSIAAGDLILIFFGSYSNGTPGTPSGFTALYAGGNEAIFYKVAAGGESSGSVSITGATGTYNAWIVYRITGSSRTIAPVYARYYPNSQSIGHDPPSLTTGWGSKSVLWLAHSHNRASSQTYTAPSGYSGLWNSSALSGGASLATVWRTNIAASEDPNSFGLGSPWYPSSHTVAVAPIFVPAPQSVLIA